MKEFLVRNRLILWLAVSGLVIFLGCLGGGGGGGGLSSSPTAELPAGTTLYGKLAIASKGLAGGIPVEARNISSYAITRTQTDESGNFAFGTLPSGLYDVYAITGDSEVLFQKSVQVVGDAPKNLGDFSLLALRDVLLLDVATSTATLQFRSNLPCFSAIEFGQIGITPITVDVSKRYATSHEADLSGMEPGISYECRIKLSTTEGQEFVYFGMIVTTAKTVGPSNFSIAINSGSFETNTSNVTLTLQSDNAVTMRVSETDDLSALSWITYTNTYPFSFTNTSDGKKKVFVQFRDTNGIESPVLEDSIILNTSGYTGIFIENGKAITGSTEVKVSFFHPDATQMKIAQESSFLNSFWEAFTPGKKIRLSTGDGLKTVYVRFKGGKADPTKDYLATILLDTTPPNGGMKINNGAKKTGSIYVQLSFAFSSLPTEMQLSNTTAPTASTSWISYRKQMDWTLSEGEGKKTIYGNFRDAAQNVLGPITAEIDLDLTPPSGNTFAFKILKDPASDIATYSLPGSFPVYLHFTISDSSTASAGYLRTEEDADVPASSSTGWKDFGSPFSPVALKEKDPIIAGNNKIWVRFGDEVGNFSTPTNQAYFYDGEQIIITPKSGNMFSKESLSMSAVGKNVQGGVGTINWKVESGSGTVTPTFGASIVYKSPDHIGASIYPNVASPGEAIVQAVSSFKPSLKDVATITLLAKLDIVAYERNGQTLSENYGFTVPPSSVVASKTLEIKLLNPTQEGLTIGLEPTKGVAQIEGGILKQIGSFSVYEAQLIYLPPTTVSGVIDDVLRVQALQDQNVAATISFRITDGPIISPTSGEAQRHRPLSFSASISSPIANPISWSLNYPEYGSFDRNDQNRDTIQTFSPDHTVTFYASSTSFIKNIEIQAQDATSKVSTASVKVIPPINFRLSPAATSAMPIIAPISFLVDNLEYFETATATFNWAYTNASSTVWYSADGNSYDDRGSLKVLSNTTSEYRRPEKMPASTSPDLSNTVNIRVSSTDDPLASKTASISIIPPVKVEIFKDVNLTIPFASDTVETVAEVGKVQFYAKVTPATINDSRIAWTVNNTQGDTIIGTIDANGLYSAPDTVTQNTLKVRATSQYDTSVSAEITVNLSDFWELVRNNMTDFTTGSPMPVYSVLVHPQTASGTDFQIFAGTNGYGLYNSSLSDLPGSIDQKNWKGVQNLSALNYDSDGKFIINGLAILQDGSGLVAVTSNGLYYVALPAAYTPGIPPDLTAQKIVPSAGGITDISAENILAVTMGKTKDIVFVSAPNAIYRLVMVNPPIYTQNLALIDLTNSYQTWDTRTYQIGSPPVDAYAYGWSNPSFRNPYFGQRLKAILYDEQNDRIYTGGESQLFLNKVRTTSPNMGRFTNQPIFVAPPPATDTFLGDGYYLTTDQPVQTNIITGNPPQVCLGIALDVNTRTTLWAAGVDGVKRSINSAANFTSKPFTGSVVNTKCIIVDPTNVINVMSGSEDGLYRSTDAGTTWKRIKSGLGNHKTINSLTQAGGPAGSRRRVWVGTTGGVFLGKQSLDLE